MTTVTPSDRTGTASSAKRPAAIPTQRSDRALRLLVLGTGDDAAAFRELAAQAGAELAQRFSVRVTHVVAEEGIGEQDARVVRARAAGVPVLGLVDGHRLLATDEQEVQVPVSESGVPEAAAVVLAAAGGGAITDADGDGDDVVEAGGEASVESAPASDDEAQPTDAGPHRRVVSLIRPRAELTPEPCDVRPSDVFTGSALEAVLHFPPLRTDLEEGESGGESGDAEVSVDEAEVGVDEFVGTDETFGTATATCGCETETAEVGADEVAGEEVGADLVGVDEAEADAERAGEGRDSSSGKSRDGGRLTAGTAASFAWALLPLVSIGLLTPIGIGYAAYRLRSRALSVAAACYTVAVAAAFAVSAVAPVRTGTHAASGELLMACLGVSWVGGTIHSFLIRRRVWG